MNTETETKIGIVIDPLDFIAHHSLLSDRSKGLNDVQFHKFLLMCEDVIKRDGYIMDYKLIQIGVINGFFEHKLTTGTDRTSLIFNHIVNKIKQ